MTGIPMVRLVLHEDDSLRVLRSALENAERSWSAMAVQAATTGSRSELAGDSREGKRHARRVAEFNRRAGLVTRLIAQLPADDTPLTAPTGNT